MPFKINSEVKSQVIKEYKQGIPLKEITNKYSISRGTIQYWIKDLKIKRRKLFVDKNIVDQMYLLYQQGKTNVEIAKVHNTTRNLVGKYLKQYYNVEDSAAHRRQKIKHNPFIDLTKDDVQYWLGYICADGNIKKNSNEIRLVTNKDIKYIEINFTKFVHSTNNTLVKNKPLNIYKYKDNRYSKPSTTLTISFCSKIVKDYLINLGITPNKSLTLKINFPITYSFLRGLLDGDGHVSKTGRSCYWATASIDFANQISNFLTSENIKHTINKKKYKDEGRSDLYYIRVSSKNLQYLFINMYSDASYYLSRKKSRFNL
jgi:hypothetical protein